MSSFFVFLWAAVAAIIGKKTLFTVTSKMEAEGNYLPYAMPNIVYALVGFAAIGYAVWTRGAIPSVVTNSAWVVFNIVFFFPFIQYAYPWKKTFKELSTKTKEQYVKQLRTAPSRLQQMVRHIFAIKQAWKPKE